MKKVEKRRKNKERQQKYSEKKRAQGAVRRCLWVDRDEIEFFDSLFLNEKKNFRRLLGLYHRQGDEKNG